MQRNDIAIPHDEGSNILSNAAGGKLDRDMLGMASQSDLMKILSSLAADDNLSREGDAAAGMIALAGFKMDMDTSGSRSPSLVTGSMTPLEVVATVAGFKADEAIPTEVLNPIALAAEVARFEEMVMKEEMIKRESQSRESPPVLEDSSIKIENENSFTIPPIAEVDARMPSEFFKDNTSPDGLGSGKNQNQDMDIEADRSGSFDTQEDKRSSGVTKLMALAASEYKDFGDDDFVEESVQSIDPLHIKWKEILDLDLAATDKDILDLRPKIMNLQAMVTETEALLEEAKVEEAHKRSTARHIRYRIDALTTKVRESESCISFLVKSSKDRRSVSPLQKRISLQGSSRVVSSSRHFVGRSDRLETSRNTISRPVGGVFRDQGREVSRDRQRDWSRNRESKDQRDANGNRVRNREDSADVDRDRNRMRDEKLRRQSPSNDLRLDLIRLPKAPVVLWGHSSDHLMRRNDDRPAVRNIKAQVGSDRLDGADGLRMDYSRDKGRPDPLNMPPPPRREAERVRSGNTTPGDRGYSSPSGAYPASAVSVKDVCMSYQKGDCRRFQCPLEHNCVRCRGPHPVMRCEKDRHICINYNIEGCDSAACWREHRCMRCSSEKHGVLTCPVRSSNPNSVCFLWNSSGTCKVIHSFICPENVRIIAEETTAARLRNEDGPTKLALAAPTRSTANPLTVRTHSRDVSDSNIGLNTRKEIPRTNGPKAAITENLSTMSERDLLALQKQMLHVLSALNPM
ncbi:hypothetical protein BC829DRAFT_410747 [Chytridium lagenaria]|nr:hypothetical protein BC829DRAFT_410747 [Chytridium lagenaria]